MKVLYYEKYPLSNNLNLIIRNASGVLDWKRKGFHDCFGHKVGDQQWS